VLGAAVGVAVTVATAAHAAGTCALSPGRAGTIDDFLAEALAARQRGDAPTSLACLSRAYTLEPSAGLLHNIARLFEDLGRYREAAEAYRRIGASTALDPALAQADAARLAALLPRLDRAWVRATVGAATEARTAHGALVSGEERDGPPGPLLLEVRTGDVLHLARVTLTVGVRLDVSLPLEESPTEASLLLAPSTTELVVDGLAVSTPLEGVARVRVEAGGHTVAWTVRGATPERRAITLAPGERWSASAAAEPSHGWLAPVIGGAATLGLAVASGVLLGLADGDRQTIADAERDVNGVVVGMTFAEADRLDARASARNSAGLGLAIGASVALVGTLLVTWLTAR
jgi:uncharacterized membrane protein (UPF0136 family)